MENDYKLKMDRNNTIGFLLIMLILGGSFFLMQPSEQEIQQEQALQDSLKRVREGLPPLSDSLQAQQPQTADLNEIDSAVFAQPFGSAIYGDEKLVTLENEYLIAKFSNKGGRIKSVELKDLENYNGGPLMLFEGDHNKFGLEFNIPGRNVVTNEMYFEAIGDGATVSGDQQHTLTMRLRYNDTQHIDYVYTIKGNSYNIGLDIKTTGIHNVLDVNSKTVRLNWETTLTQKEKNISSERERSTIFYQEGGGDITDLSSSSDDREQPKGNLNWIAFKQHYFSNILVSKSGFTNADLSVSYPANDSIVKLYKAVSELDLAGRDQQYSFDFFFGPNKYKTLRAEEKGFENIINMGWGPMGWINRFITVPVFDFLDGFHMSYGIVILILTLLLKGALFPLTYKSYVSMAKMRVLKPELDEIKEKVGQDNPMLLQQEQMKLYKKAGVNPLGGCLPLLLQMPFTIAFFFFFPNLFELRGESFLWVKDLSTYDSPISFPPLLFGFDHISMMCVLMTVTTVLTTWYNNTTSGVTGQMKYIGYVMPFVFFFVLNNFPAGLNYYYFLSAVFTFLIQVMIRQFFINDEKILAKIEENKKKPESAKKKSSFQQRMEEMMRQQQAAQQKKGK